MTARLDSDTPYAWDEFPPRQQELLLAIARGLSNEEIADELGISLISVQDAIADLYNKLGCVNRVQVVLWLMAHEKVAAMVLEHV